MLLLLVFLEIQNEFSTLLAVKISMNSFQIKDFQENRDFLYLHTFPGKLKIPTKILEITSRFSNSYFSKTTSFNSSINGSIDSNIFGRTIQSKSLLFDFFRRNPDSSKSLIVSKLTAFNLFCTRNGFLIMDHKLPLLFFRYSPNFPKLSA